jgi:hypothetical protein
VARIDDISPAEAGLALEQAVSAALSAAGWSVEAQPVIGTVRPDLLVSTPRGEHVVVEVKAGKAPVHFGVVAQLAAYSKMAESMRQLGGVRSALLTMAPVSAAARDAAAGLGVMVVGAEAGPDVQQDKTPSAVAAEWVRALERELRRVRREDLEQRPIELSDRQLGELMRAAKDRGWTDETVDALRQHALSALNTPGVQLRMPLGSAADWVALAERLGLS